jgi:hypothetical protein
MVTLAWLAPVRLLMKRKEYYHGISNEALVKKLRYYKIKKLEGLGVSA